MIPETPPIVFIPGLQGSRLVSTSAKETRWVSVKQVLNLDKKPLLLDEELHAAELVEGVLWLPVYRPLTHWLQQHGQNNHIFTYDWRQDCSAIADQLVIFLEKIVKQHGKVIVMAHSLGGLITFKVLNERPDLFHSVIFAGVPFGASIDFAKDMHHGHPVGINRHILSKHAQISWHSPYVIFPLFADDNHVVTPSGETVNHDWYSLYSWEKHRFSVFADEGVTAKIRIHMIQAMQRAKSFRENLTPSQKLLDANLKISVLTSRAHPTLNQIIYRENHNGCAWDFENGLTTKGDGRISYSASLPPAPLHCSTFYTNQTHPYLFNDSSVLTQILAILL